MQASNYQDVMTVAFRLLSVAKEDRWKIVATVYDLGLMRFRSPLFRACLWIVVKLQGRAGLFAFFQQLQKKAPEEIDNFLQQTATHIVDGKDLEDKYSVGGLSQREMNLLLQALETVRME